MKKHWHRLNSKHQKAQLSKSVLFHLNCCISGTFCTHTLRDCSRIKYSRVSLANCLSAEVTFRVLSLSLHQHRSTSPSLLLQPISPASVRIRMTRHQEYRYFSPFSISPLLAFPPGFFLPGRGHRRSTFHLALISSFLFSLLIFAKMSEIFWSLTKMSFFNVSKVEE